MDATRESELDKSIARSYYESYIKKNETRYIIPDVKYQDLEEINRRRKKTAGTVEYVNVQSPTKTRDILVTATCNDILDDDGTYENAQPLQQFDKSTSVNQSKGNDADSSDGSYMEPLPYYGTRNHASDSGSNDYECYANPTQIELCESGSNCNKDT